MLSELETTYLEIIKLGLGLVILMAVNIVMGAVNSIFESDFCFKQLFKGIGKAIILILCFSAVYIAGILNSSTLSVDLGTGSPVGIIDAMHALLLAGYFSYSKQVFVKMGIIIGVTSEK